MIFKRKTKYARMVALESLLFFVYFFIASNISPIRNKMNFFLGFSNTTQNMISRSSVIN